jgi:hypothetical protein
MACELNVSVKVDPAVVLNEAVVTNAASVIPFATPDAFAVNCCGVLGSRSAELGDAQRPIRQSVAMMARDFMWNVSFNSGESRGYVRSSVGFTLFKAQPMPAIFTPYKNIGKLMLTTETLCSLQGPEFARRRPIIYNRDAIATKLHDAPPQISTMIALG